MAKCIYSGESFVRADGEHILQNALGARWQAYEIVCNKVQKQFGETIDVAVADGVHALRTILGNASGRGNVVPPLRNIATDSGDLVDVGPGLKPRLREPKVEMITGHDGQPKVKFTMGDFSQIDWVLAKAQKMFPGNTLTKEMLLEHGETSSDPPERLKIPIRLGGTDFFRGMLKSCFNLFGVNYRQDALDDCFNPLKDFVLRSVGNIEEFVGFLVYDKPLVLPQLGPVDHGIFLVQHGASIQGIVRYFGGIVFPFQLTDEFPGRIEKSCGYIVNPYRDSDPSESRTPLFSNESIPRFSVQERKPNQSVWAGTEVAVSRILNQHFTRQTVHQIIAQAQSEVFGSTKGTPITAEQLERLKMTVNERLAAAGLFDNTKDQQG